MRNLIYLKLEDGIIGQSNNRQAQSLTTLCISLGLINTLISCLLFLFLVSNNYFGFAIFSKYLTILVFLFHVLTVLIDPIRQSLLRDGHFSLVSNLEMIRGVSRTLHQIVLGILNFGFLGLIVSEIISRLMMVLVTPKKLIIRHLKSITSISGLKANELKFFPLFVLPSSIITVLLYNIGTPLINYCYGSHGAGLYALIIRSVTLPLMLFGNTIADVFYNALGRSKDNSTLNCFDLFKSTAKKLIFISIIFYVGATFLAPRVFDYLLGQKWHGSGMLIKSIAPWLALQLLVTPLSRILYVSKKQYMKLIFDFAALMTLIVGITLFSVMKTNFFSAIFTTSLIISLIYVVYFVYLYKTANLFNS